MAELDLIALGVIAIFLLYAFNKVLSFKGPTDVKGGEEKEWHPSTV